MATYCTNITPPDWLEEIVATFETIEGVKDEIDCAHDAQFDTWEIEITFRDQKLTYEAVIENDNPGLRNGYGHVPYPTHGDILQLIADDLHRHLTAARIAAKR